MNLLHRWICRSAYWEKTVETELLPWALNGLNLGGKALEIGPGYGFTTDTLRTRVGSLTTIEIDSRLAASLSQRSRGTNVSVLNADGAFMPFADEIFDSALCFTMLHHVPSAVLQDRLLSETARVLRPGGVLAGTDSLPGTLLHLLHIGDTMTLVDWRSFPARLQTAGFTGIEVETGRRSFRFRARRASIRSERQT